MNAEHLWQYAGAVGGCMYILDGIVVPQIRAWLDRRTLNNLGLRFPGSGGAPPPAPVSMPRPPRPHFVRLVCEQCGEPVDYPVYPSRGEKECAKGRERPYPRPVVSSTRTPT
jgi:hypothetical protein